MAKNRMINTKFWSDPFIQELDSTEKLLYLYFLTNEHTNISGFYELSIRTICFEIGIKEKALSQAVDRLSQAGKIHCFDGWVYIKNFIRHQYNNPSVQKGILRELEEIPIEIKEKAQALTSCIQTVPTVSQDGTLNLTKLNLTKLNGSGVSKKSEKLKKPTIEEISDYCHERKNKVDPTTFLNHYESNGWMVGKVPMKDWKAAARTWEKNSFNNNKKTTSQEDMRSEGLFNKKIIRGDR